VRASDKVGRIPETSVGQLLVLGIYLYAGQLD